jgi:hypothetical protein
LLENKKAVSNTPDSPLYLRVVGEICKNPCEQGFDGFEVRRGEPYQADVQHRTR